MKDGMQGISHDRVLMRIINYMQILGWICGFVYGAHRIALAIEQNMAQNSETNAQVVLLQQQVSSLQQLVVNGQKNP